MYLSPKAPKNRIREAQNARNNRMEIMKAISSGQVTRRDLMKWGLLTSGGFLAAKHGLSPFAPSAYGGDDIPTGVPPSPLFGATKFSQPLPRLNLQDPLPVTSQNGECSMQGEQYAAKRLSWHTDFTDSLGSNYKNPRTGIGPCEGRAPGNWFAHQRWNEQFPKKGHVLSIGQIQSGTSFHPSMPAQNPNSVWAFGTGRFVEGVLPPPLIQMRYGEPRIVRIYNNLPLNRAENMGFGRNEFAMHNHNAHNGAESDGATNNHIFPGQFYDYLWGTCLARTKMNIPDEYKAYTCNDNGGLDHIPGDYRELQGTLWFHDHRFFFTAENVYKGMAGMLNYYSGPDRGNEHLDDGVNLRLPSGWLRGRSWGNIDFDVNLLIADMAFDPSGQYFFDRFNTDGFLGDLLHVNFAYSPRFEVLPRKYRFRLLNACMSRFLKLCLVNEQSGKKVPFQFIANDGNFLVNPLTIKQLDEQGTAERYDIVVDFSQFEVGDKISLVNVMEHDDGRGPKESVRLRDVFRGESDDPAVGRVMEFRVVDQVESVDSPGYNLTIANSCGAQDRSHIPNQLTEQIPLVEPDATREIEWKRGGGDSRETVTGECWPDCGPEREDFPWVVRINGEDSHSLNANRISNFVPQMCTGDYGGQGDWVEHWTFKNGGGGWDHPIHLHYEEAVTFRREGNGGLHPTENMARKDVWRLGRGGSVTVQVRFGEYAGSYVNHCHNTVHEDFAMLTRFQVRMNDQGELLYNPSPTPMPRPEGVDNVLDPIYDPEILPEGDYRFRNSGDS